MKTEPVTGRTEALAASLQRHRIFGNASEEAVRTMLRRSHVVTVAGKEVLFSEGKEGHAVAVVLQGFIKLCSTTVAGREIVLEVCGPGSMFGEIAVLNGWPRAANAVALSECKVLSIDGEVFRNTLVRSPEAMFALVRVISRRLREATDQVRDSADLPGPARLAKALGQLAATHAAPVPGGLRIAVQLSQRELGAMTGLSRESINKQLAAWRDDALISFSDRHITLLNVEALRTVALEGEMMESNWRV